MKPDVDALAAMNDALAVVLHGAKRLNEVAATRDDVAIRAYFESPDYAGVLEAFQFLSGESVRAALSLSPELGRRVQARVDEVSATVHRVARDVRISGP